MSVSMGNIVGLIETLVLLLGKKSDVQKELCW